VVLLTRVHPFECARADEDAGAEAFVPSAADIALKRAAFGGGRTRRADQFDVVRSGHDTMLAEPRGPALAIAQSVESRAATTICAGLTICNARASCDDPRVERLVSCRHMQTQPLGAHLPTIHALNDWWNVAERV
jgi:hypothetical protein